MIKEQERAELHRAIWQIANDLRFSRAGVLVPKSKADLSFTMHMLAWLSTIGTAAIVEFPGVLYRGGAEQKIRKYLVDNNFYRRLRRICSRRQQKQADR